MPIEEVQAGKKSQWMELEITGNELLHLVQVSFSLQTTSALFNNL